jgi:adenylate cyclase
MFTDMVGFTASAQTDEANALKLLEEQEELLRPLFRAYQGREIKSTGDGFLVEFDSALRAVQCAVDIHRHLQERNANRGGSPIRLRIGVHLGDVEERGGDIFGDSVNLAARIEPMAEPGGICISGAVFGQIQNKIPNRLEKLGPTALKNVRYPIEVYRVVVPGTVPEALSPYSGPAGLAVLPFANISPDPNDEYFADGLTEELITVLSLLRGLRVIARTSVMPYKSTSKRVSQIGSELHVSSVLEGSVRKAGNRLRVSAQLIDVASEGHLWAATYDRKLDDVFAVQTELARQVAEALRIELRPSEGVRLGTKLLPRPDSYLAYLKGRTMLHSDTRASLEGARQQFELAISLDAGNASAHSGLADVTRLTGWWFPEVPRSQWNESARLLAARAIELDPNLAEAHASLGLAAWDDFDYPAAERELKLALSLNPSYSLAHHWYGALLEEENRADEALVEFTLAEGADPLWSVNLALLAQLLLWLGRLDEALVKIQRIGELDSASPDYHTLMARYHLNRSELPLYVEERNRFLELFADPRRKPLIRALTYAVSGEKEKAQEILRQEETQADVGLAAFDLAHVTAELGDLDACFRWLRKAAENHELPLQPLRLDPRFQQVRDDPRFHELLTAMNLA